MNKNEEEIEQQVSKFRAMKARNESDINKPLKK